MKLQPGDEIRIVAPSRSWPKKGGTRSYLRGKKRLEQAGFTVTFSEHLRDIACLGAASPQDRAADIHAAYRDPKVKLIMALRGGWLTNDVLPYIDWEVLQKHPKPFVGYSDITVLHSAILAKTGQVSYLGPNLAALGERTLWQYSMDTMFAALSGEPFRFTPNRQWIEPRGEAPHRAPAWRVLQPGAARGVLRGGNIASTYITHGTPYDPPYDRDYILAVEDDDEAGSYGLLEFSRRLEALLQQPGARKHIRGLIVGRFLPGSRIRPSDFAAMLAVRSLGGIPIVYGADFGHTMPLATLPLGAIAELRANGRSVQCTLNA